jgi:hypothetical protein
VTPRLAAGIPLHLGQGQRAAGRSETIADVRAKGVLQPARGGAGLFGITIDV